jgi:enoyl-CoA hydratase/carnithine racemase
MVNLVMPRSVLEAATLELAQRLGTRPTVGLRLAKMAFNQSLDAQGERSAIQAAFALSSRRTRQREKQLRLPDRADGRRIDSQRSKGPQDWRRKQQAVFEWES